MSGTANDTLSGISAVAVLADGKRVGWATLKRVSATKVTWGWVGSAPAGSHTLSARAFDRASQASRLKSVPVSVTKPAISKTVIPPTTEVLSGTESAAIRTVTPTTVTFTGASPATVGEFIVSAPAPGAEGGLLRRVSRVATSNGVTVVTTSQAALTDVITQGGGSVQDLPLQLEAEVAPAASLAVLDPSTSGRTVRISPKAATTFTSNLGADFDFSTGPVSASVATTASFKATADVSLKVGLKAGWGLPGPEVKEFKAVITLDPSITANVSASGKLTLIQGKKQLTVIRFKPITFMAGPVPVVIVPKITPTLSASLSAGATVGVEAKLGFNLEAGVRYANGSWSPIKSFTVVDEIKPVVDEEVTAKVGVSLVASFALYDVVGPAITLAAETGLNAKWDALTETGAWTWKATATASAGGEVSIASKTLGKVTVASAKLDWTLASGTFGGSSGGGSESPDAPTTVRTSGAAGFASKATGIACPAPPGGLASGVRTIGAGADTSQGPPPPYYSGDTALIETDPYVSPGTYTATIQCVNFADKWDPPANMVVTASWTFTQTVTAPGRSLIVDPLELVAGATAAVGAGLGCDAHSVGGVVSVGVYGGAQPSEVSNVQRSFGPDGSWASVGITVPSLAAESAGYGAAAVCNYDDGTLFRYRVWF